MEYRPKVEDFYEFRNDLLNDRGDAFKKLVIHQISYSGLGTKSGGPLGGKKQKSKYKIDCRWSAEYICKEIDMSHRLLNKFETKLSSQDFSVLLQDTDSSMLIYLDPPYYVKGNELYSVQFSEDDHERLADMLKEVKCKWVLSYDKNDRVLELYKWARIEEIFVNYTITGSNIKKEVIITNG
jgi:DNA adenine methylase